MQYFGFLGLGYFFLTVLNSDCTYGDSHNDRCPCEVCVFGYGPAVNANVNVAELLKRK